MITLKNVKTLSGNVINHTIESKHSETLECHGTYLMMPALIDTDVNLLPISGSAEEMTAWIRLVRSFLASGISTIFDTYPHDAQYITGKMHQATEAVISSNLPVHLHFFCNGEHPGDFDAIGKVKSSVSGLKVALDLAKGSEITKNQESFDRLFQIAAQDNLIVNVSLNQGADSLDIQKKTAYDFISLAINAAEKYSTELGFQHIRTQEELLLIKQAKKRGLLIYTEVALLHLFMNTAIEHSKDFVPTLGDQKALWESLKNGSIDFIGSSNLQFDPLLMLPLIFDAYKDQKIDINTLISVTRINPESIFRLAPNPDIVLVDLETKKIIPDSIISKYPLLSHFKDKPLVGWPVHVIAGGQSFTHLTN